MLDQLYIFPILLFSVIIHEVAHGWMALRLGDTTARDMGRLTLNPIPHIDPVGSIIIPLLSLATAGSVFIAWAKPVPVNPGNFLHRRRDDILVSVIGPLSNVLLAVVCTGVVIGLAKFAPFIPGSSYTSAYGFDFLMKMFYGGMVLNIVLALFNMIPLPPLDGSHVLASLLPENIGLKYRKIGFAGILFLLLLMRWNPFAQFFWNVIHAVQMPFDALIRSAI